MLQNRTIANYNYLGQQFFWLQLQGNAVICKITKPYIMTESLNQLLKESFTKNWDHKALCDLGNTPLTFGETAQQIAKLHLLLQEAGIKPQDKIALCGKNSANWAMAFLATITYGAVPIPILNDFKAESIHNIVNHSDSRILWLDDAVLNAVTLDEMPALEVVMQLGDFTAVYSKDEAIKEFCANLDKTFAEKYPTFGIENLNFHQEQPDEVALINYTSGSTGFSKGVVLPYRALWSNVRFAIDNITYLKADDGMINMLPLAHMYGLAIEMLFPLCKGCYVCFLGKTPSPKILMGAFAQVQPKLIIAVPLILEKIIRSKVLPTLKKPLLNCLMHIPGVSNLILAKVRKQLIAAFGGQLEMIVLGGAALNGEIEDLLRRMKFPYTVGYGMTECAPLIAYAPWYEIRKASCGKIVDRMEARIVPLHEGDNVGELWVKGTNTMLGYYKNQEATDSTFKDGWMNTGDLCVFDKEGFLYIKGRNKNLILGPSGQNIYPEEIEDKINNLPYVAESLVVDRDGLLVALVVPDFEKAKQEGIDADAVKELINNNRGTLNKMLASYSQITRFEMRDEEFEKTPKRSIRRFLYK